MSGAGIKAGAFGLVTTAYVGLGLALLATAPEPTGGGAPVIEVTLEPAPRFDGPDGATPQVRAARASGGGAGGSPSPPSPRPVRITEVEAPEAAIAAPQVEIAPSRRPSPTVGREATASSSAESGAEAGAEGATGTAGGEAESRAGTTSGGGAARLGARAADDEDRYAAAVLAWIESHKSHPGGGATGVVGVAITLDRGGRLRQARVSRSSGSASLDRTALSQLAAMQPFPRPAPGARWARRQFDVLIDYRVR